MDIFEAEISSLVSKKKWVAECKSCGKKFDVHPIRRDNLRNHSRYHDQLRADQSESILGKPSAFRNQPKGTYKDENIAGHYKYSEE